MTKIIIKEIIIIFIIGIAIFLVQGILLYEYIPKDKKAIKVVEAYELPNDVSQELEHTIENESTQKIVKTYSVNSKDLKGFEKSNDYNKGKINPFSEIENSSISSANSSFSSSGNSDSMGSSGSFLNTVK